MSRRDRDPVSRVCVVCLVALLATVCACQNNGSARVQSSDPLAAVPDVSPTGDWRLVQSGQDGSEHWTLYVADATPGGRCFSIEFEPPQVDPMLNTPYRGRRASCSDLPGPPGGVGAGVIQWSFDDESFTFVAGLTQQTSPLVSIDTGDGQRPNEITADPEVFFVVATAPVTSFTVAHLRYRDGNVDCPVVWRADLPGGPIPDTRCPRPQVS